MQLNRFSSQPLSSSTPSPSSPFQPAWKVNIEQFFAANKYTQVHIYTNKNQHSFRAVASSCLHIRCESYSHYSVPGFCCILFHEIRTEYCLQFSHSSSFTDHFETYSLHLSFNATLCFKHSVAPIDAGWKPSLSFIFVYPLHFTILSLNPLAIALRSFFDLGFFFPQFSIEFLTKY